VCVKARARPQHPPSPDAPAKEGVFFCNVCNQSLTLHFSPPQPSPRTSFLRRHGWCVPLFSFARESRLHNLSSTPLPGRAGPARPRRACRARRAKGVAETETRDAAPAAAALPPSSLPPRTQPLARASGAACEGQGLFLPPADASELRPGGGPLPVVEVRGGGLRSTRPPSPPLSSAPARSQRPLPPHQPVVVHAQSADGIDGLEARVSITGMRPCGGPKLGRPRARSHGGHCCRRSLSFLARRSHHLLLSLLPLNPDDAKAKAAKAAKTVKKNTHTKKRRVRTSVVFHRPRTLQLGRTPKFPRQR